MLLIFNFFLLVIYVNAQNDTSPCPRLFVYEGKSSIPNRWYGIVTLLSDSDLEGIWLRLIFNSEVQQIGNWFGEVQSIDDGTEFLIKSPNYNLKAFTPHPIRFYAQYEQNRPIPRLVSFLVNAKIVCPEQKKLIDHTTQKPVLQTSGVDTLAKNPISQVSDTSYRIVDDDDYFIGDFALLNKSRNETPSKGDCGSVIVQPKQTHRHDTIEGEYPWQANIYYAGNIDLVHICAGSLISKDFVLTAAHCFYKNSKRAIFPNELIVYLGKFHLHSFTNVGIQDRAVSEIIIHPKFNSSSNDLALLQLDAAALVTNYVRPVCLWQEEADVKFTIGKEGVTAGWGFDVGGRLLQQITQARMEIVSKQKCSLFLERSVGSFCARFSNDSSICNIDSGGGLFFAQQTTNGKLWQLRGVVSVNNWRKCDPSKYVVFTDVAKYVSWIKQIV